MGISGRELTKDYSVDELCKAFIDNYGRIQEVAKQFGCSRNVLYDYLDLHPEIKEARKKGSNRFRDFKVETAEMVIEKIMDKVEDDPVNAGRQAQFILKNGKDSPYYEAKEQDVTVTISPAERAYLAERNSN